MKKKSVLAYLTAICVIGHCSPKSLGSWSGPAISVTLVVDLVCTMRQIDMLISREERGKGKERKKERGIIINFTIAPMPVVEH